MKWLGKMKVDVVQQNPVAGLYIPLQSQRIIKQKQSNARNGFQQLDEKIHGQALMFLLLLVAPSTSPRF